MDGDGLETISSLLTNGADPNAKYPWNNCPVLYNAVDCCDASVVKALLDAGAYPDQYWENATPLHFASELKKTDSALALIDAGASFDAKGPDNWTPIMYASMNCDVRLVKRLIEKGSDLSVVSYDMYARTPLTLALSIVSKAIDVSDEDQFRTICLLIDAGASIEPGEMTAYAITPAKKAAEKARAAGKSDIATSLEKIVEDIDRFLASCG